MAILDTFYILFKSDSKDAEQGFKSVNNSLSKMDQSLNRFSRRWLSLYALFTGLTKAVGYAFELTDASLALGVNTEALDAWGGAVQKTGGTVQGFQKSLQTLAEHLGTTPKIALQVLPKLADQFKKLNQAQALRYGGLLGLDTPTILLLQQGRREVEALIKRQRDLGVVTSTDAIIFRKFKAEIQDTGRGFRTLVYEAALTIIPTISKILHAFQEFSIYIRKHTGLIKGALLPIAAVFIGIAGSIALANIPMTIFIASIIGLAAAFALAYDDLQVFAEGGDSITGRMLKRWPEVGEAIKLVFSGIKIGAKAALWFLEDLLDKINTIIGAAKTISNWISPLIDKALAELKIEGADINLLASKNTIETASKSPITSQLNTGILGQLHTANKELNLSIGEITIVTQATDARDISSSLGIELQKQFRQTQNNFAGGQLI